jgi:hypothetical protein
MAQQKWEREMKLRSGSEKTHSWKPERLSPVGQMKYQSLGLAHSAIDKEYSAFGVGKQREVLEGGLVWAIGERKFQRRLAKKRAEWANGDSRRRGRFSRYTLLVWP